MSKESPEAAHSENGHPKSSGDSPDRETDGTAAEPELSSESSLTIQVKWQTTSTIRHVTLSADSTICQLKQSLRQQFPEHASLSMRLIAGGRLLHDQLKVADYNIKSGDTVFVTGEFLEHPEPPPTATALTQSQFNNNSALPPLAVAQLLNYPPHMSSTAAPPNHHSHAMFWSPFSGTSTAMTSGAGSTSENSQSDTRLPLFGFGRLPLSPSQRIQVGYPPNSQPSATTTPSSMSGDTSRSLQNAPHTNGFVSTRRPLQILPGLSTTATPPPNITGYTTTPARIPRQNPPVSAGGMFPPPQSAIPMMSPEAMQRMMQSPLVQSLLERPDFIRLVMDSNPQLREIRDRNPELNHILNDPQLMRDSMDAVRNPNIMRELMRNTDRAMSNIESMPGGFNALRRMYQSIQQPIWEATVERKTDGAAASGAGDSSKSDASAESTTTYSLDTDKAPNTEALPNPWAASSPEGDSAPNRNLSRVSPIPQFRRSLHRTSAPPNLSNLSEHAPMSNISSGRSGVNYFHPSPSAPQIAGTGRPLLSHRLGSESPNGGTSAIGQSPSRTLVGQTSVSPVTQGHAVGNEIQRLVTDGAKAAVVTTRLTTGGGCNSEEEEESSLYGSADEVETECSQRAAGGRSMNDKLSPTANGILETGSVTYSLVKQDVSHPSEIATGMSDSALKSYSGGRAIEAPLVSASNRSACRSRTDGEPQPASATTRESESHATQQQVATHNLSSHAAPDSTDLYPTGNASVDPQSGDEALQWVMDKMRSINLPPQHSLDFAAAGAQGQGEPSPDASAVGADNEQLYRAQMVTLSSMGFTDRDSCLRALQQCDGNINRAIDRLLIYQDEQPQLTSPDRMDARNPDSLNGAKE